MGTRKQRQAARQNVKKAQKTAKQKRTLANLSERTRKGLGKQGAKGRTRSGKPGHALENRNREQIYEIAKDLDIEGRSKMGKWELIDAIREAR